MVKNNYNNKFIHYFLLFLCGDKKMIDVISVYTHIQIMHLTFSFVRTDIYTLHTYTLWKSNLQDQISPK